MDLIGQLAGQLGIAPAQAQALAGTVLGAAQRQAPPEAAAEMSSAIPEMSTWQQSAEAAPAPSALGGLFGAAAGALGGQQAQDAAAIVTLLGRFGLDPSKAATVAPIILNFLTERLDGEVLQTILKAAPMLAGAGGAVPTGDDKDDGFGLDDAAGMLGSLFGRK